jgi:hypothetical protein
MRYRGREYCYTRHEQSGYTRVSRAAVFHSPQEAGSEQDLHLDALSGRILSVGALPDRGTTLVGAKPPMFAGQLQRSCRCIASSDHEQSNTGGRQVVYAYRAVITQT